MYHPACSKSCSVTSFTIGFHLRLRPILGILALCAGFLAAVPAWAQPVQNVVSSHAGSAAGDWSNPGNVVGPADNNCANMGAVGKANLTYNFDFNIPLDATITGATAFIKAGATSDQNIGVQLASNASVDPPTKIGVQRSLLVPDAGSGNCSATQVAELGTTLADWSIGSLTPAIVNSVEFGLVFTKLEASTFKVDSICLEIVYETDDGLSALQECFGEAPNEFNNINIIKDVVGTPPDSAWAFNGSGGIGDFSLPAEGGFFSALDVDNGTFIITETPKAGYTVTSECFIDDVSVATGDEEISVTVETGEGGGQFATCVFTNTLNTADFTVNKTYDDSATGAVTINLVCEDGVVTTNDLSAAPNNPAVFEVTGFDADPNCTATESGVPAGYTADNTDCVDVALVEDGECTIANTANTGTFTVRKLYTAGPETPVSVTASCTAPAMVTNNPQMASPSASAIFNVTRVVPGVTTCTASEVVPSGYTADESDCQDNDPIDGGCVITNSPIARATFRVTKDFTDDNPSEVLVSIDCNTGFLLDQEKWISEGDDVVFVVTQYTPGILSCHISEVIPEGYSPSYDADLLEGESDEPTDDELGCHFESVVFGDFQCSIVNTPDPVDVVIEKAWIIEGSGGNSVDTRYELELYCNAEIVDGSNYCGQYEGISSVVSDIWCETFYGEDSDVFIGQVIPEYPNSQCWVNERVYDHAVEIDNGCQNLVVSAGQGDSCLITNTVFFEGIPTLGQYGKMLLVLLMLGMGIVGFRRIA